MDALPLYTSVSTAYLLLQSIPLFLFPRLIISLLSSDDHVASSTETYLARLLSLALTTLAIIGLYFAYFPPPPPYTAVQSAPSEPGSSSSNAIVHILTLFHAITFVYIYTRWLYVKGQDVNTAGYVLGMIGYGFCSCVGIWVLVFGTGAGRHSKRTGADKRTSGWPFKNDQAYNKKVDRKMG